MSNNFTSTAEELNYTFADSGNFDIQLIATNQFGCADTTLRTIIAFVPSTDLLIIQADAEITNNYLQVSALVANNSPYDIVNATISLTDNLGHSLRETITDTIKSGKIIRYIFASEVELSSPNLLKYICVNIEPVTNNDTNPTDNRFCLAINLLEFSVEPIKPNPVDNYLKINYIVLRCQGAPVQSGLYFSTSSLLLAVIALSSGNHAINKTAK